MTITILFRAQRTKQGENMRYDTLQDGVRMSDRQEHQGNIGREKSLRLVEGAGEY